MSRTERASTILLGADAIGCAAAALVVAAGPSLWRRVSADGSGRVGVVVALAGSAVAFALAARRPSPATLGVAALANGAWTATCLASAGRVGDPVGRVLVVATGALDGVAGAAQLGLAIALRGDGRR